MSLLIGSPSLRPGKIPQSKLRDGERLVGQLLGAAALQVRESCRSRSRSKGSCPTEPVLI